MFPQVVYGSLCYCTGKGADSDLAHNLILNAKHPNPTIRGLVMLFARGLAVFVMVLPYVWHSLSHSKSHSCVIILHLVLPFLLIGSAITVHDGYRCAVSGCFAV